jgi:hypothetical protein
MFEEEKYINADILKEAIAANFGVSVDSVDDVTYKWYNQGVVINKLPQWLMLKSIFSTILTTFGRTNWLFFVEANVIIILFLLITYFKSRLIIFPVKIFFI